MTFSLSRREKRLGLIMVLTLTGACLWWFTRPAETYQGSALQAIERDAYMQLQVRCAAAYVFSSKIWPSDTPEYAEDIDADMAMAKAHIDGGYRVAVDKQAYLSLITTYVEALNRQLEGQEPKVVLAKISDWKNECISESYRWVKRLETLAGEHP